MAHSSSNSRILCVFWVTVSDGCLDDPFGPEGAHLEHFLKADNVIVFDNFHDFQEALFLVVVMVGLDRGRTQENVESEQPEVPLLH